MVSDWMLNWRILLSPGLSLYCLHWPEGASADAAQRMHNRSFITTCSQKKNPWTAKPFSWIENQQQWKDQTICRWWQSVCWRGSRRRWWATLCFFSILFFETAYPRSHGKSSGELAQYNAQACWRRRGTDQSLLCPLNHFFKRVRGQVKLHFFYFDASCASFFCFFLRCLVRPSIQLPGWKWTSTKKDLHIREHSVLHLPCSQEFLWPSTPGAQQPEWPSSCFLNCEHVTSKSSTIPAF